MDVDPTFSFHSSCDFWKELRRTINTRGQSRILIIDPNRSRGGRVASLFRGLGKSADSLADVRGAYRLLRDSPDFDAVLLHADWARPSWTEIVQQFRGDPWTADLPIAVLFENNEVAGRDTTSVGPADLWFPTPADHPTSAWLLGQLAQAAAQPSAYPDMDLNSFKSAATQALGVPMLAPDAKKVLTAIPSQSAR
jgi:CheY-like chemotaxis protein